MESPDDSSNAPLVGGVVGAIIVILIVVAIVLGLWYAILKHIYIYI